MAKTKIVLDADVIIHFSKGNRLTLLAQIFPNYDYVVLSTVYNEVLPPIRLELDNNINLLRKISLVNFCHTGEMMREYALLTRTFGKGESACMSYCKFNNDVIGSSNLKDIREYCNTNNITYLTTIDFLYYAIKKQLMTIEEANEFVNKVTSKGSKLPEVDFNTYTCGVLL